MHVEDFGDAVFAFSRTNGPGDTLLILNNLTGETADCALSGSFLNILTQETMELENGITLDPYQFCWLKLIPEEEKK